MLLRLLRHGLPSTGGGKYEAELLEGLAAAIQTDKVKVKCEIRVLLGLLKGWKNLYLLLWGWLNAKADITISVARLAIPALLRNRNGTGKTIIVLHYFDKRDKKSRWLRWYYGYLFRLLKKTPPSKVALVVVSPWFHTLFRRLFPKLEVFLVPNLFENKKYLPYRKEHSQKDGKQIFLGQYSFKNDVSVFRLAELLHEKGYRCFFCTLYPHEAGVFSHYEVICSGFEEYLEQMASSYCTISFTGINEGWSRLTHESLLVDTPVIGYGRGGLGDLLHASESYIVKGPEEAVALIEQGRLRVRASNSFFECYDARHRTSYLKPLKHFIQGK